MEDMRNEDLKDFHRLHEYILQKLQPDRKNYVFIDEIQETESFEKVLNSLQLNENVDLYITGSNSKMLSGELATYLSGRYVEIPVYPFSYSEYLRLTAQKGKEPFQKWLQSGGLPDAIRLEPEARREYLRGIYNTVLLKDVVQRKRFTDVPLLERISEYLADNISNPVSVKGIADYISTNGRKTTQKTVDAYLKALAEAYLVYPVERYDLRGKKILERNQKYYFGDTGLRQFLIGEQFRDLGRLLENAVFLELKRRGYSVYTGRYGEEEIDFTAVKGNDRRYYQVSSSILDDRTRDCEFRPLLAIRDNYPKTILTLDDMDFSQDGILHQNLIDFLLEDPSEEKA